MANTRTRKKNNKQENKNIVPEVQEEKSEQKVITKTKKKSKVKIPLDLDVACRSAVRGTLSYLSKRQNGYQVVWNDFGDEQFIEFQELVSMRNTDLRFFKDNWIVIEDSDEYTAEEIMDALKVSQYYKVKIDIDNFDSIFNESPDTIKQIVSKMSKGLKETVGMRAKQLYYHGKLDSVSKIKALEESLGIEIASR